MNVKIRRRDRVQASPPRGMRQSWQEYQVVAVATRKILHRADMLHQAIAWCKIKGHAIVEHHD